MAVNLALPQITRIPIQGPEPYNTLVCVEQSFNGGPQWVTQGKMSRFPVTVQTNFRLAGFDQRVVPQFEHATTAMISSMGPAKDDNWVYAADEVTGAGFSQVDGSYFVNVDMAVLMGEQADSSCWSVGDPTQGGYTICLDWMVIQVLSYVLCYEPPLPTPPPKSRHWPLRVQEVARQVEWPQPKSHAEMIARQFGRPFVTRPKIAGTSSAGDCRCSDNTSQK